MVYGYSRGPALNEEGLVALSEISFDEPPHALREIGKFLVEMAELLEKGAFRHTHIHIESFAPGWKRGTRDTDVIVCKSI